MSLCVTYENLLTVAASFTIPVVHLGEPSPMPAVELALTKQLSRDFRDLRALFLYKLPGCLFIGIRLLDSCNEART